MPDTLNDGGIRLIQQTISANDIATVSTTYIVTKGSLKAGSNRIVSKNEQGVEKKQALFAKIREGTIDCQFVNPADKLPARFQTITVKDASNDTLHVIIAEVDDDFGADTEADFKLTVYEAQAGSTPEAG